MARPEASDRAAGTSLASRYESASVEARWVQEWAERALPGRPGERQAAVHDRDPAAERDGQPPPRPRVRQRHHRCLIRFKRLQGFEALFQPGTDHAGISTQVQVERALATEGTDRHALGREAFLERAWSWKERYGGIILEQLQRLGVSADWTRSRFTLDEGLSRAVRKQFVDLYHRGGSSAASASSTGTR
jgi:valyl-tRNA synthetase